jgi:hypothetical protein
MYLLHLTGRPGNYIVSARASNNSNAGNAGIETCDVLSLEGTSMATPVTAGNAALIRQYFTNSSFWEQECLVYRSDPALCSAFSPSGVLVKAVMLTSGEPMEAYSAYSTSAQATVLGDLILGEPPDEFQGYGRIQLSNVLPLAGFTPEGMQLFMEDQVQMTDGAARLYEIDVTSSSRPLVFTVSWYDPPNVLWSGRAVLNDIDVSLVSPSGQVYYGNNIKGDELNNNERIYIIEPELGRYTVNVTARAIVAGTCFKTQTQNCQNISVVAVAIGTTTLTKTLYSAVSTINSDQLQCEASAGNVFYVSLQAYRPNYVPTDYWGHSTLTIQSTSSDYSTVLTPRIVSAGYNNSWLPCASTACLSAGTYEMVLFDDAISIGAAIDSCGAYVSKFQLSVTFTVQIGGACSCKGVWTTLEMTAPWYPGAGWGDVYYYEVIGTGSVSSVVLRGTLVTSNEGYHKLCLPDGVYDFSLIHVDSQEIGDSISLTIPSCSLTLDNGVRTGRCKIGSPPANDDDDPWELTSAWTWNDAQIVFTVALAVFVAAIAGVVYCNRRAASGRNYSMKESLLDQNDRFGGHSYVL